LYDLQVIGDFFITHSQLLVFELLRMYAKTKADMKTPVLHRQGGFADMAGLFALIILLIVGGWIIFLIGGKLVLKITAIIFILDLLLGSNMEYSET
jgi:hypothetical protein